MVANNSWYNTGFDGMKKEEDRLASMTGPNRLWIPADSVRDVVFIDDDPINAGGFMR